MDTLKKRRFEFIDEDVYQLLGKRMKQKLSDYREQYRLCILKEKRINTLKKQGSFVSKIFMGSSFNEIVKSA